MAALPALELFKLGAANGSFPLGLTFIIEIPNARFWRKADIDHCETKVGFGLGAVI